MRLDENSVRAGYAAGRRSMFAEVKSLRDQILQSADRWDQLAAERDQALAEFELARLHERIVRAAQQRAEIAPLRAFTAFAIAQRDPTMLLH